MNNEQVSMVALPARESTCAWEGDVVVAGATLAGVTKALSLAGKGQRVLLVESGPTLGREISIEWQILRATDPLTERLAERCAERGSPCRERVDIFLATLALDRMVLEAGVTVLVAVRPMRAVAEHGDRLTGLEVAGKSGRQLVRAGAVVDATPGRRLARRALGRVAPRVEGWERAFYLSGVELTPEKVFTDVAGMPGGVHSSVRLDAAAWPGEAVLRLQADASSRAEAVRRTLQAGVHAVACLRRERAAGLSEAVLVDVSPECRARFAPDSEAWDGLEGTGLTVLPETGDPYRDMEAARAGDSAPPPTRPWPEEQPPASPDLPAVRELAAAGEQDLVPARLPATGARLHAPVDVVVAGGGTGGVFAALAAAEEQVSVTLLDSASVPGGIGTAGRIHSYYHGVRGGMQERLDERVQGCAAGIGPAGGFHPVAKAEVLSEALREAGVTVQPGHTVFGAVLCGRRVEGVLSAAEDGYHVFPCRIGIDGSGDGDLAAAAGAETALGREGDGFPQPYSYTPSRVVNGKVSLHNFDAGRVDPTDALDFSRAHFEGRQALWMRGPFSDDNHYCTLAGILGVREGRFVRGTVTLRYEDFLEGRIWPDAVCEASAHYDNHAVDYAEESDWARRHVVFFGLWWMPARGQVPYACLYPGNVDNVLMACRALSVDHDMHQLARMQRDMQALGEVCGVAATWAVREGCAPSQVDVNALQRALSKRGLTCAERPRPVMDVPAGECVQALGTDRNGLAMWRLTRPAAGMEVPDWEALIEGEHDADRVFSMAMTAVLSGADSYRARECLRDIAARRTETAERPVRTPPRYVAAALALAETGDSGIHEVLAGMLNDERLEWTSATLVLRALAECGEPSSVPSVRAFLERVGNEADAGPWERFGHRASDFRASVVLRAVRTLYALGDRSGAPWLVRYCNDGRLLFRRYARRIAEGYAGR